MDRDTAISDHLIHVGGGTGLVLAYLGLIPGFIPFLALTALVTAVVVAPFVILGLAVALVATPPYVIWRLATRARRRRPGDEQAPAVRAFPVPTPHGS